MLEVSTRTRARGKKVLYVITKSNFGGAGKYVLDLAISVKDAGFDVAVACGGGGPLVDKLREQNIRTIDVPNLKRDISVFKEFQVLRALRTLFKNEAPDVIHLNSSKIGGIGALAGRLEKVPKIIFTAHGWAFNENRGIVWKMFTYLASYATAILSHIVITISYKEEEQALNFPFVGVEKVRMIYNGIGGKDFETKESAQATIEELSNISIQSDTVAIGSIGELHKNKGYMYALKMCEQLVERKRKFVYLIIGEGEERHSIEKYIREKHLNNYVKLLGAIPDTTSGAVLIKAFDILLLPSTKEGLPYVLLEAGVANVPIVATRVGGVPEIIEHEKNGLLAAPQNEGALTLQVEKILYDSRLREDYSRENYKIVINKFTLEQMVENVLFEYLN